MDGGSSCVEELGRVGSAVAVLLDLAQQPLQILNVESLLLELLRQIDNLLSVPCQTQLDVLNPGGRQIRVWEFLLLQRGPAGMSTRRVAKVVRELTQSR